MGDGLLKTVAAASVLSMVGLYGYALCVTPAGIDGSDGPDGKYVSFSGTVREVKKGSDGQLYAEVVIPGNSRRVWLVTDADADPYVREAFLTGAKVEARGFVSLFRDRFEVRVEGYPGVKIIKNSSLQPIVADLPEFNNTSVCFSGLTFYKKTRWNGLDFILVDRANPELELRCVSTNYKEETAGKFWDNGSLVRVFGKLKWSGDLNEPTLYISGGERGIEIIV